MKKLSSSDHDEARSLERLGYAQELLRAMGGFSSFALSFSVISVLTGVMSTYGDALRGGGPAGLGIGWPVVCVGTLVVALAMAELASSFPTAGALYHWSALLGGPAWGWVTAMMNLVGMVAIVGAIDLVCAQTLAATLGRASASASFVVFAAILASHAVINVFSVRLVAILNELSATVHIVGVLVLVVALLAFGRVRSVGFAFDTSFTTRADHAYPLGFLSSLVLGMWTFTGFDASAHAAEETRDPARRAPWGIVSSVVVSAVAGYALVLALTMAIKSLPDAAGDPAGALFVLRDALGGTWGDGAMGLVILAMWFCGLSSVTSASRMLYAFARDDGVPFASHLRKVSPRLKTPAVAIVASVAMPGLLILAIAPFSEAVFVAVATLATIGFYVSYGLPIALGAVARTRGKWRRKGPWHLGALGVPMAWLATAWTVFVVAVCVFTNRLSGALLAGVVVTLAVLYLARVRGTFRGPKIDLAAFEATLPGVPERVTAAGART